MRTPVGARGGDEIVEGRGEPLGSPAPGEQAGAALCIEDAVARHVRTAGLHGALRLWLIFDYLAVVAVGVQERGDDAAPVLLAACADEFDAQAFEPLLLHRESIAPEVDEEA